MEGFELIMTYYIRQNIFEYVPYVRVDSSYNNEFMFSGELYKIKVNGITYKIYIEHNRKLKEVKEVIVDRIYSVGDYFKLDDKFYKVKIRSFNGENCVCQLEDMDNTWEPFNIPNSLLEEAKYDYNKLLEQKKLSTNIFDQIGIMFMNLFNK